MPAARRLTDLGTLVGRAGRRLSLRARLLLGLLAVAAVGLIVADAVVYNQIESYLNNQVNIELRSGATVSLRMLDRPLGANSGGLPLDTAVEVLSPKGARLYAVPGNFSITGTAAGLVKRPTQSIFDSTASVNGTTGPYRVIVQPVLYCAHAPCFGADYAPAVALVAIPTSQLQGTLNRLQLVEVLVTVGVLAVLVFLGYLVVRVGMRPLVAIAETAGAIAAGDLSRRVDLADDRTEVGRLGAALNAMLAKIERAFSVQRASEERLRQFLADASHELRTPVTSIRGYAELFRRGAANRPEDLALAMRRIEDESIRMGVLVEDLLLLARLDQGRPLEAEPVDLAGLAIDAAADAQVVAPDRDITVDADSAVTVIGDEQRLRQVVGNLVQNALRHTPAGTPVTVGVSATTQGACLIVRDEGPGLTSEQAERVFERFYRADPSRTRGSGGSGLGLSIVASIALAHGGKARVESEPGRGATFVVELPLGPSANGTANAAAPQSDGHFG
ncbi:MAG: periplasmic sensor signal transduction histidine kinase [Acidimicrobiaceae bacterium]|nr:periplasmic sensor signal transduction histidine kinase [Acidimicrobiaceae bacterium]